MEGTRVGDVGLGPELGLGLELRDELPLEPLEGFEPVQAACTYVRMDLMMLTASEVVLGKRAASVGDDEFGVDDADDGDDVINSLRTSSAIVRRRRASALPRSTRNS